MGCGISHFTAIRDIAQKLESRAKKSGGWVDGWMRSRAISKIAYFM